MSLVKFYLGKEPDHKRRWIDQIWEWDHDQLEQTHDYIQWLFPLKEKSGFNPTAPALTDEVILAFKSRDELKNRLLRSLDVMLAFSALRASRVPRPSRSSGQTNMRTGRKSGSGSRITITCASLGY